MAVAVVAAPRDEIVRRLEAAVRSETAKHDFCRSTVVGVSRAIDALWDYVALVAGHGAVRFTGLQMNGVRPHARVA